MVCGNLSYANKIVKFKSSLILILFDYCHKILWKHYITLVPLPKNMCDWPVNFQ